MACVYGSRLLLLKTITKNSRGQKGVFLMTFSFIDAEHDIRRFFSLSQFKYNYSHVCEFFLRQKSFTTFHFRCIQYVGRVLLILFF